MQSIHGHRDKMLTLLVVLAKEIKQEQGRDGSGIYILLASMAKSVGPFQVPGFFQLSLQACGSSVSLGEVD